MQFGYRHFLQRTEAGVLEAFWRQGLIELLGSKESTGVDDGDAASSRRSQNHQPFHTCTQGLCARGFVVWSHRFRAPRLQRKTGPNAILGLRMAFLVTAMDQGVLQRRYGQAEDVIEFLEESRGARRLVGFSQVRLDAVGSPDLDCRGIRDVKFGRQLAHASMGSAFGRGLFRHAHNLRCIARGCAPAARQAQRNCSYATFGESITPPNTRAPADFESSRNLVTANSVGSQPHSFGARCAAGILRLRYHAPFQLGSLIIGQ